MKKCWKNGKAKFHSKFDAELRIAAIKEVSTADVVPTRAYYCGACDKWHLTSRRKARETVMFKMSGGDLKKYEEYKK